MADQRPRETRRLWVEGLPLAAGSHTLTLTATDAAGNVSSQNITVNRSAVSITINPPNEADLVQPTAAVSGTIDTGGYNVWVNGTAATVSGTGWSANNVPINDGGTAIFNVRAIPSGVTPTGGGTPGPDGVIQNPGAAGQADARVDTEKPAYWYIANYHDHWRETLTTTGSPIPRDTPIRSESVMDWANNSPAGGTRTTTYELTHVDNGPSVTTSQTTWPQDTWPPTKPGTTVNSDDYHGQLSTVTVGPPDLPLEVCRASDTSYSVAASWTDKYVRSARTTIRLKTGGRSLSHRCNLFRISATAHEIRNARWRPGVAGDARLESIPPNQLDVGSLGQLGSDGNLYVALPEDMPDPEISILAPRNYYQFTVGVVKHTPHKGVS